jgi:hypothetical protein
MTRERTPARTGRGRGAIGIAFGTGMVFALVRWAGAWVSTTAESALISSTLESE